MSPFMGTAVARLVRAELRLMTRDPLALTFVFVFPIVTMLIIGGSFGTEPDPAFSGVTPAHWYVASYLTDVIAATGLVIVPVHLASYRERGVLRRFAAADFPRWSFAFAELVVGLVTIAVAAVLLLLVAAPVYGIPAMHESWRVVSALVLGAVVSSAAAYCSARCFRPRGPRRPSGDPVLSVVSARRRRAAAAGHGIGSAAGGRRASADPGHQRRAQSVAGIGVGHRVTGGGGAACRGGHRRGGPPNSAVRWALRSRRWTRWTNEPR
jgi:hypothetical protein